VKKTAEVPGIEILRRETVDVSERKASRVRTSDSRSPGPKEMRARGRGGKRSDEKIE